MLRQLHEYGYDAPVDCYRNAISIRNQMVGRKTLARCHVQEPHRWSGKGRPPGNTRVRSQSQEVGFNCQERSVQSKVARTTVRSANRLDIPPGTPSGDRVTRARRSALGNCLDVQLAQIVWERVLYLYSLIAIPNFRLIANPQNFYSFPGRRLPFRIEGESEGEAMPFQKLKAPAQKGRIRFAYR